MGTRSLIGYYNAETGAVKASYVHYDGYVRGGVGQMLVEHYNDDDAAWLVGTGGYLSGLEEDYEAARKASAHSDPATDFASVKEYLEKGFDSCGAEYVYLWDGEAWFVAPEGKKFTDIETVLVGG